MEFSCMDSMAIFLCMDAQIVGMVHMNFHAKSGVCSSKNGWVMSTFVLIYFLVLLYFCNLFKWLRAVKIYLHAKYQHSSSKIDRVMLNFVFCTTAVPPPPVTNLPVHFAPANKSTITEINITAVCPWFNFKELPFSTFYMVLFRRGKSVITDPQYFHSK